MKKLFWNLLLLVLPASAPASDPTVWVQKFLDCGKKEADVQKCVDSWMSPKTSEHERKKVAEWLYRNQTSTITRTNAFRIHTCTPEQKKILKIAGYKDQENLICLTPLKNPKNWGFLVFTKLEADQLQITQFKGP